MSWGAQRGHERAQRVVASSCIPALRQEPAGHFRLRLALVIRRLWAAPAA